MRCFSFARTEASCHVLLLLSGIDVLVWFCSWFMRWPKTTAARVHASFVLCILHRTQSCSPPRTWHSLKNQLHFGLRLETNHFGFDDTIETPEHESSGLTDFSSSRSKSYVLSGTHSNSTIMSTTCLQINLTTVWLFINLKSNQVQLDRHHLMMSINGLLKLCTQTTTFMLTRPAQTMHLDYNIYAYS